MEVAPFQGRMEDYQNEMMGQVRKSFVMKKECAAQIFNNMKTVDIRPYHPGLVESLPYGAFIAYH